VSTFSGAVGGACRGPPGGKLALLVLAVWGVQFRSAEAAPVQSYTRLEFHAGKHELVVVTALDLLRMLAERERVQLIRTRLTHSRFGLQQVIIEQRRTHVVSGACSGQRQAAGVSCIAAGCPARVMRLYVNVELQCRSGAVQMCDQMCSPSKCLHRL